MEAAAATEERHGSDGLVGLLGFCKGVAVASCRLLRRPDRSGLPKLVFRTGAAGAAAPPKRDEAGRAVVRHV